MTSKHTGLTFPKVIDPEPLFYQFNTEENAVFLDTMKIITQSFVYARYRPLTYYKVMWIIEIFKGKET
jgi:hypothetical protein